MHQHLQTLYIRISQIADSRQTYFKFENKVKSPLAETLSFAAAGALERT